MAGLDPAIHANTGGAEKRLADGVPFGANRVRVGARVKPGHDAAEVEAWCVMPGGAGAGGMVVRPAGVVRASRGGCRRVGMRRQALAHAAEGAVAGDRVGKALPCPPYARSCPEAI